MARQFVDAIARALGHAPEEARLLPGKVIRFSSNGKRGDDSGWALLFADERGGVFGDWRTGFEGSWQAATSATSTRLKQQRRARDIERLRELRDAEALQKNERAAAAAAAIWEAAALCVRHAYAQHKRIGLQGLRMQRGHLGGCAGSFYVTGADGRTERLKGDLLIAPMYGPDKRLWSLQAIDADGRKSFLKGGRVKGLFFPIGSSLLKGVDQATYKGDVAIAEGVATAATVHQLGRIPVFAAFNAGNLAAVAQGIRQRLPLAQITIAGDIDASGVGQVKAEAAARTVAGFVSFPPLTAAEIAGGATDWNDYQALHPGSKDRARQA